MTGPLVVIFHQSSRDGEPPLTALLASARQLMVRHHVEMFRRAGAASLIIIAAREDAPSRTFGERLAAIVAEERPRRGIVVLGGGAVPLLRHRDATHLVRAASARGRRALTNNRYSSDVCAVSDARILLDLPPLPSDNALPRWLDEVAGTPVRELRGRRRLALDMDTPLDLALVAMTRRVPSDLRRLASVVRIPGIDALRAVAADPRRELLVLGRSSASTLRWLERRTRCRVRALVEERGLKVSAGAARPPSSVLGRLLDAAGPDALGSILSGLADGAIIDSRVLLAHRMGADERAWPSAEDRFRSDLLLSDRIEDPWLAALTRAAASSPVPILLGAHTLVGPGIPVLLGERPVMSGPVRGRTAASPGTRRMLR
jgi:hypothetical protein